MLTAIGEQTGKPLIVREDEPNYISEQIANLSGVGYRGVRSNYISKDKEDDSDEIQFQKIKVKASVYVKFEIK